MPLFSEPGGGLARGVAEMHGCRRSGIYHEEAMVNRRRASFGRQSMAAAVVLCSALLLGACQGGISVAMQRDGTSVSVTIRDETGLIASAEGGTTDQPSPLPASPAVWNPNGDLTRMTIYWQSTACSQHPVLHLSGNALLLTIDPGPSSGSCGPGPVANFVTVRLRNVIDVSAVRLSLAGS
jgi:hypothetical protein